MPLGGLGFDIISGLGFDIGFALGFDIGFALGMSVFTRDLYVVIFGSISVFPPLL